MFHLIKSEKGSTLNSEPFTSNTNSQLLTMEPGDEVQEQVGMTAESANTTPDPTTTQASQLIVRLFGLFGGYTMAICI